MDNDELHIELDLTKITASDLEGEAILPPDMYHIVIVAAKKDDGALKLRYQVLASAKHPETVGSLASERFFLSDKAIKRLVILGHRLGLIDDNEFGGRKNIDWSAAQNRDLIVQVINEEYEKKDGSPGISSKWTYAGFWSPDDERAGDCPRGKRPTPKAPPARAAASPPRQVAQAAGVDTGGANDFSDV